MTGIPTFKVSDYMRYPGGRRVAYTTNPTVCNDFVDWVGRKVRLDPGPAWVEGSIEVECLGVERFAHRPPFRAGESIGIVFKLPESGQ